MDVVSKKLEDTSNIQLGICESRVPSMKQCTPRGAGTREAVGALAPPPLLEGGKNAIFVKFCFGKY